MNALAELLEPTVRGLGFELWGVEYVPQGKSSVLRVYIDAEQGIGVDDCAQVSHQVSGVLDVEDPIPGEYYLEVSSPGMDRSFFKLSQYADYLGQFFAVRLRMPLLQAGQKPRQQFKGRLLAVEGSKLTFQADDQSEAWVVNFEQIKKAHLIPLFK